MAKVVRLPVPVGQDAEAGAHADNERKHRLFAWANTVLRQLGLDRAVLKANSLEALRRITLDVDSVDVLLAIRDALHPTNSPRQEHFRGLRGGGLKQILKNRFAELKKNPKPRCNGASWRTGPSSCNSTRRIKLLVI
jgi:hypothetical protein